MVKFWVMQIRMHKVPITDVPVKYRETVIDELKKLEAFYEK